MTPFFGISALVDVKLRSAASEHDTHYEPLLGSQDLALYCTVSGSHMSWVEWYRNGIPVSGDDFLVSKPQRINGKFQYGQTSAIESNITWNMTGLPSTCEDMGRYNGQYTCKAYGQAAGLNNSKESPPIQVVVQCK